MKHIQGYIDISPDDFKEVFQVPYSNAIQRIMNSRRNLSASRLPSMTWGATV
jgi:hypothetical protein